jgi:GntR family transcriptional regulator of vanillate catabolism
VCAALRWVTSGTRSKSAACFGRYAEINEAFHAGLWRLAKSAMLRRSIEQLLALPFTAPGALVFSWPDPEEGNDEAVIAIEHHRAIVEAIELREGWRAESLAREHAQLARRALKRALQNAEPLRNAPGATLVTWHPRGEEPH